MKSKILHKITIIVVSLFTVPLLLLDSWSLSAQTLDRVVAIINDDIITLSELEDEGKEYLAKIRQSASEENSALEIQQAKQQVLDKIVNQRLIDQEARKANVMVSDQEFERNYEQNLNKIGLSRDDFLAKLKKSGLTEEKYKSELRTKLLRDKLVHFEVRSKIIVTEEMITEHFHTNYSREVTEGGYYLLQIGFKWENKDGDSTPADKEKALQRAKETRELIKKGEDFRKIAKEKSEFPSAADGGDLGVFQKDEMADYMQKAVLPLSSGDVSEIIESPNGYQFFKLLTTQKGDVVQQVPYDSVKEDIRKKLFEEKFAQEYKGWVEKIKKGSYIKKMLY